MVILSACQGVLLEPGEPGAGPGAPGQSRPPYEPGDDPLALPLARIWRLSPIQYERSFVAAFGASSRDASDLGPDPRRDGFDDVASQNHVDARWVGTLHENAAATAAEIEPDVRAAHPCVSGTNPGDACVDEIVAEYADRAFRRETSAEERAQYVALFSTVLADGNTLAESITAVIEALAQSPFFVYRIELGAPRGDGTSELDDETIASQLSYMLTDAPPDAALMADAHAGRLHDRSVVRAHAERLLETPDALAKVTRFFDQFLGTYLLDDGPLPKEPDLYPAFTPAIQAAMQDETHRFVRRVFTSGGTVRDLFESDTTSIDDSLRAFYGWSGTASPDVPFTIPDGERAGVFMQGAVLAARSGSAESDALHRGLFVYQELLCNDIAPPPGLDVNSLGNLLDTPDPEDTERQRFEFLAANNPECSSCHGLFVPLGLGLETFDATGVHRTTQNGRTLDASGWLRGSDNDGEFADGRELLARVGASAQGQACFAQHWVTFAFGGELEVPVSSALLARLRERALAIRELVLLVVEEDAFYLRREEEEP